MKLELTPVKEELLNSAFSTKLQKDTVSEANFRCRTENNILEPKKKQVTGGWMYIIGIHISFCVSINIQHM
jgi:hypothetical protein